MLNARRFGKRERRLIVVALVASAFTGLGFALAAGPATRGPAATGPRSGTSANKAAAEAQLEKATALYLKEKFAEAQVENDKALALDPTNTQAQLMRQVLQTKLAGGGATAGTTGGTGGAPGKIPLLTMSQVNLIRAMEAGPNERLTGRFDPKLLEDFWTNVLMKDPLADKSRASHDRFLNPSNFPAQLQRIKEANDLKYLQGVTLNSDPATLMTFKNQGGVHNYVLQNCATAECHASTSPQAGNFRLVNPAPQVEQQYTNFYILNMYANKDGKMIDRDNPEKSLLLLYGLPYANAPVKHPKVEARRLTGLTDPRLRSMNDWIKALAFPKPNYGIAYEVPGTSPAPATTPATGTRPTTR